MRAPRLNELDWKIYRILRTEGERSTPDLAERLGEDRGKVYRSCRKLKDRLDAIGNREVRSKRTLFFFPVTGEVLTEANRDQIQGLVDELDDVVSKHSVKGRPLTKDQKTLIRSALKPKLDSLAARATPRQLEQLARFRERFEEVLSGTGPSHARGAWSPVPYSPSTMMWYVTGPLPGDEEGFPVPLPGDEVGFPVPEDE